MRHPFDGIIIPEMDSQAPPPGEPAETLGRSGTSPSRRSVLRWLLALPASVVGLAFAGRATAADQPGLKPPPDPIPPKPTPHRIYFIVPKDAKTFDARRRKELGIMGKYLDGWPGRKEFERTEGFSAWLTPAEAAKIASQPDVLKVHQLQPEDVVVVGRPRKGFITLRVALTPNNWPVGPDQGTYLSTRALTDEWSKQFARFRNVKVTSLPATSDVFISFSGVIRKEVITALKANPQVSYMEWVAAATTFAMGEEGDRPQPTTLALGEEGGRVTTQALGEEGGYPPTTQRLGEEGGYPPTTQRFGEEGDYPPTTHRFGEEGSYPPTTQRLGEEGGVQPTTLAIGEEGGPRPTTLAVGEEGGIRPPGRPSPPGQVTTQALGEEG